MSWQVVSLYVCIYIETSRHDYAIYSRGLAASVFLWLDFQSISVSKTAGIVTK